MSPGELATMLCLIRAVLIEQGAVQRALLEFFMPDESDAHLATLRALRDAGFFSYTPARKAIDTALRNLDSK